MAGIGVGLLMTLVMLLIGVFVFEPFYGKAWNNPGVGGHLFVLGFAASLALGGIASGIDALFLAQRHEGHKEIDLSENPSCLCEKDKTKN